MNRLFLGWDRPIVESAAEWLWRERELLASTCVVVPTAQAGRRLREAVVRLAEAEGAAVLGLRTVTPARFLDVSAPDMADPTMELLAWMQVLESIDDWSPYHAAFPHPLAEGETKGWSQSLAQSLMDLRFHLQENGLLMRDAQRRLGMHDDAERWQALARIEEQVEALLTTWHMRSRAVVLQNTLQQKMALPLPTDVTRWVMVGVTETSPFVAQMWQRLPHATVLIGAPEEEAEHFDACGFPCVSWCERFLPFPGRDGPQGNVVMAADARQLAEKVVDSLAQQGTPSDQVMLAVCDASLGAPLVTAFARAGWPLFDPGTQSFAYDWRVWLKHWQRWLSMPSLAVIVEMATCRETQCLTGPGVVAWLNTLGVLRDQCLVERIEDVEQLLSHGPLPRGVSVEQVESLVKALRHLRRWRQDFFQQGWATTMLALVERWQQDERIDADELSVVSELVRAWQPWEKRFSYDPAFWMQLLIERLPVAEAEWPEQRALDVEGWLEVAFHHTPHLILCGMSDASIPGRCGGEPWLNQSNRKLFGLNTDQHREARDAYLFYAMQQAHRTEGRVEIFLSKTDVQGKILLPSRLLMRARGTELAERVARLFAELPAAESQMQWSQDFSWQPRKVAVAPERDGVRRLSVTALRDYLACPYRFYLKHGLRMQSRDGDRGEWNHRDFGNLLHEIMEVWGRDADAAALESRHDLAQCWNDQLSALLRVRYGEKLPLALRLQSAALRQRLDWLAEAQAQQRAEGWQVWQVETAFLLPMPTIQLSGKIDRIDYHPGLDAYQMWDYKTGSIDAQVSKSHLKTMSTRAVLPEHLQGDERLFITDAKNKKSRWTNLQLPLYAAAGLTPKIPTVGYIEVGDSADAMGFRPWTDFDESTIDSARACAEWLTEKIAAEQFWPPNEKTPFDEFAILASGSNFATICQEPS
jgi:ATP-dependent helicase/nuclease subunit B